MVNTISHNSSALQSPQDIDELLSALEKSVQADLRDAQIASQAHNKKRKNNTPSSQPAASVPEFSLDHFKLDTPSSASPENEQEDHKKPRGFLARLAKFTGEKLPVLSLGMVVGMIPGWGRILGPIMQATGFDIRLGISVQNNTFFGENTSGSHYRLDLEARLPAWALACVGSIRSTYRKITGTNRSTNGDKKDDFIDKAMLGTGLSTIALQCGSPFKTVKFKISDSLSHIASYFTGADVKQSYQLGMSVDSELGRTGRFRFAWTNGVEVRLGDKPAASYYSGLKTYIRLTKNLEGEFNGKYKYHTTSLADASTQNAQPKLDFAMQSFESELSHPQWDAKLAA